MANNLYPYEGSPLCGSPIIYRVNADWVNTKCSFHRVKLAVRAAINGSPSRDIILSSPAEPGEQLLFDVSSALRSVAETYEYTPEPPDAYPYLVYDVYAHDEWMLNGDVHEAPDDITGWSISSTGHKALFGAYTDLERLLRTSGNYTARHFTRKPKTTPEIIYEGHSIVVPRSFDEPISEAGISTGPTSEVFTFYSEGFREIGGRKVYVAKRRGEDTYMIRFVNSLGCLESVSVYSLRETDVNVTQTTYLRSVQERFSTFSRSAARKSDDYETWKLSSGPLDEAWQAWFIHEFLMAEQAWVWIGENWIPCHILSEETVAGYNRRKRGVCSVEFSLRLDINGSPLMALAVDNSQA